MIAVRRWVWNGSFFFLGGVRGVFFGVFLVGSIFVGLDRGRMVSG